MASINIVVVGGNLTRDPELRYLQSGTAVCEFGLGVNRTWKSEDGEKKTETSFFNCVGFGRTAENVSKFFQKGDPIVVEGRLKQEQWEDKETGKQRQAVKVIVERFHFGGASKKSEGAEQEQKPERKRSEPKSPALASTNDDDDVPF